MIQSFVIFLVALFLLVEGSDFFVEAVSRLARLFKVSDFLIGLTVVAIGTSLPELATSLSAALQGQTGLIVGNVVGSNLANIGLILAVATFFSVLTVRESILRGEGMLLLVISLMFFILALDLTISRVEGLLFLFIFILFLVFLYYHAHFAKIQGKGLVVHYFAFGAVVVEQSWSRVRKGLRPKTYVKLFTARNGRQAFDLARLSLAVLLGVVVVLISSYYLVLAATDIVTSLNISSTIIGLTLIAIGTSLPELAVAITAARKGKGDLIIGTILGSNIYNLLLVVGLSAMLSPLAISAVGIWYAIPAMLLMTTLLLYLLRKHWLLRKQHGILLLQLYIVFFFGLVFWVL
jgi:cation:H+ antiporter